MAKPGARKDRSREDARRSMRARPVSDMLPEVGGAAFRRFGFVQSSVVSRWREIVGERYAVVSSPESIRFPPGKKSGGVLTLSVEGAHAPMMQHVVPTIIERVNRFFGYPAVERVSIRQGIVKLARSRTRQAPAAVRPVPLELGEGLRAIADPELRACLEAMARGVAEREARTSEIAIPVIGKLKG